MSIYYPDLKVYFVLFGLMKSLTVSVNQVSGIILLFLILPLYKVVTILQYSTV